MSFLRVLFRILVGIFGAIVISFFAACSDNSAIEQSTNGIVPTHIKPQVIFKDKVSDNINAILQSSGEIHINGKKYFGKYIFDKENALTLLPDSPLNANQNYKINFDFDAMNKAQGTHINAKNFTMNFSTNALHAQIESADFIKDSADLSKMKLEARIHLSQSLSQDSVANAIKLANSKQNHIPLNITSISDRELLIASDSLPLSDESFALTIDKDLGLEKSEKVMILAQSAENLKVIDIKPILGDKNSIKIRFSAPLMPNGNIDNLIRVSPSVNFRTSQSNDKIILSGDFSQNSNYKIEILKGIKSRDGLTLSENFTRTITLGDKEPKIVFSNSGVFLPDSARKQVAFKSVNVKKARIVVRKIYANNIAYFLADNSLAKRDSNDFYLYSFDKIGDVIFEKEISIDAPKNEWIQSAVDLSKLRDLSGIFVISLHFDKDGVDYRFPSGVANWRVDNYFYENGSVYKQLIFSNIALLAQKFGDEMIISALNIKDNEPLVGVEIAGISKSNQVISKATTDIAGNAKLKFSKAVGDSRSNITYIMSKRAGKNDDFALIKLSAQEISDDGFDTDGVVAQNGIKAFIYTDRGVYRPSEVANLTIIARNNDKAINHPIKLSITNPRGKVVVNNASLESSGDGVFYYAFKSEKSAFTGIYNIKVDIGGNIFTHKIAVESIVPSRIKLALNAQDSIDLTKEQNLKISLQSDYLFGAPASGLEWNISPHIEAQKFISQKYKGWSFESLGDLQYFGGKFLNGKLNESGFVENSIDLDAYKATNQNLIMHLTAQVFENNGRAITQRKNITLKKFDSFVGIKMPANRYIKRGDSVNLNVVLLDERENFIKNRNMEYIVYQNNYSWWWDYSNKNDFIRAIKGDKNTQIIARGAFKSKDRVSNIKFEVKDRGEILVEVIDTTNNQRAQVSLYASSWGEPLDIEKITQLKIKANKDKYAHGESAKVTFESVKGAKALITISSDKEILKRYWVRTTDLQTSFEVAIDEKHAPNLYASVFLLQDYGSADNDRALRLYGVVPLKITNEKNKIALNIKAKDEIRPNSTLDIEISNAQNKQVTYTLAIVDEGLLNLTNFKTPSPYNYFYAKTKYNIRNFDTFDYIIGKIEGAVRNSYSIGGDLEMAGAAGKGHNNENAERFKPVVHFIKPTKSDKNGRAKISFNVPSYIGALRVMLVAVDNNSYGNASKEVRVSAPVVMLPTIPRSLKVNDSFQMPIEIMRIKDSAKSANVAVRSSGIIKFDKNLQEVRFDSGKKSQTIFFNGRVKEKLGVEKIALQLNSDDFIMRDLVEIDIKAPNPYTQISKNWVLKGGESADIIAPSAFIENSNAGKITLSAQPLLNIEHRLKWLMRYPYGCLEQSISSVFPQLFIAKLASESFAPKQQIVDNINAGIARIQSFQVSDGGFSYWSGAANSDEWGSSYATHFLIMAKMLGYKISDSVLNKAIGYLKNHSDSRNIYPLYLLSLSDNHQLGAMNEIYENHLKNLSVTNRWLLAASYAMAGFEDIALKISNGLSLVPNESQDYFTRSYGSHLRNKAMILQAHKIVTGNIDADLYNEIKSELEGNEWLSTQDLAYALLVMASIKDEAKVGDIVGEIVLNNKAQKFSEKKDRLEFTLNSGSAKVKSPNMLFVNYSWEGIASDSSADNIKQKMQLKREFVVFDENGNDRLIDARELKSGDSFYMRIMLVPHGRNRIDMQHIALSQNLPSGWEVENTRLNNDALPSAVAEANNGVDYTDIRDDRISWFFSVGESKVVYVKINSVTPGEYTLPAALAEAMYEGSYRASSESERVRVLAK